MAFTETKPGAVKKVVSKVNELIKNAPLDESGGGWKKSSEKIASEQAKQADNAQRVESLKNFNRLSGEDVEEMGLKKGGSVKSASKRADGCAQRGKTRGRMV